MATNLKWAMHSNSVVISPALHYETWFMEGTLRGGEHFIEVKPDFSDLEEKIDYYLTHENEAQEIQRNAFHHTLKFFDRKSEYKLNLLILKRYMALLSS